MPSPRLSESESRIVLQCMTAVLESSEIEDPEFETRLGFDRKELRHLIENWASLKESDAITLAVSNCLNEVCNGIDIPSQEWDSWFDVPKEEVKRVCHKCIHLSA